MGLFTPEHWLVNNLCLVWKGPPAPAPGGLLWTHYVFSVQNARCLPVVCSANAVIKMTLISWRNVTSWKCITITTFYDRASCQTTGSFWFPFPGGTFVWHLMYFIPPLHSFTETCNWFDPELKKQQLNSWKKKSFQLSLTLLISCEQHVKLFLSAWEVSVQVTWQFSFSL